MSKFSRVAERSFEGCRFWGLEQKMDNIGIALIVGGAASLCSGLIFLLPVERGSSSSPATIEQSINEIEAHLQRARRQLGDPN
jgi:hypothetical protein